MMLEQFDAFWKHNNNPDVTLKKKLGQFMITELP